MNIRIFLFFIVYVLFSSFALALDVVYPTSSAFDVTADSVFFIGNVNPKSTLKINSDSVTIWDKGAFVYVVPVNYGLNTIKLTETYNGKNTVKTFNVKRIKPVSSKKSYAPFVPKKEGIYLYSKTVKNYATVREKPSVSAKRVTDLPEGVVLYLSGKSGDFYKIEENGATEFWIHKSNITEPVEVSLRRQAKVGKCIKSSDKIYNYYKFAVSYPVLFTTKQINKQLKVQLYGALASGCACSESNGNIELTFEDENQVLGYEGYYKDGFFILKRAKVGDKINQYAPLHGIKIYVDAGHGGTEKGAAGPTRVYEKDINLAVANELIKLLKAAGAVVSYSRTEDKKVALYDRVQAAKDNNAFISLSIHCNSLPFGKNPYITHGVETHYYNDNAKVLAYIIKNNLVKDLNLKDNGLYKSNFALTRSTNPISVLIEVAYIINPEEYKLLQNPEFRKKIALSVKKSLEEYMVLLKK